MVIVRPSPFGACPRWLGGGLRLRARPPAPNRPKTDPIFDFGRICPLRGRIYYEVTGRRALFVSAPLCRDVVSSPTCRDDHFHSDVFFRPSAVWARRCRGGVLVTWVATSLGSSKTSPYPGGLAGPDIVYFWGLNGPSYRKTHWKRWGCEGPHILEAFPGPRGRPDLKNAPQQVRPDCLQVPS